MNHRILFLSFAASVAAVFAGSAVVQATPSPVCSAVVDPVGDFKVSAPTSTPAVSPKRADILAASMRSEGDHWLLSVTTSQPFILHPGELLNVLFLFDRDGQAADNYPYQSDVRAGADTYYILTDSVSSTTLVLKREYLDLATYKWRSIATSSTFQAAGASINVSVPYDELPKQDAYHWRANTILGTAKWLVRDAAPERSDDAGACGYLPLPPASGPTSVPASFAPTSTHLAVSTWSVRDAALALLGLVAVCILLSLAYRRMDDRRKKG